MRALITLATAVGCCGLILLFGSGWAEQVDVFLGSGSGAAEYAVLESVFALVIFGFLLGVALIGGLLCRINPLALGRNPFRSAAIGTGLGLGGLATAAGYAWVAGVVGAGSPTSGEPGLLLWGSVVLLFTAGVEEIYFRGWLQPVLAERFGPVIAIVVAALAFAALHLMGGARSPMAILNLFLGGVLFGLLAARGGGIAGAVAAHFSWNWSEQLLLGLDPNPGIGSFGAVLDLDLAGPALWGGSDEGLNGSVAMALALIAILVPLLVLATTRAVPRPAMARA